MKKIVLLLISAITIVGCKKEEIYILDTGETEYANLTVNLKKTEKLSTGEEIQKDLLAEINTNDFIVWEAEGKNFEIKSLKDVYEGYAYDKISQKSYSYTKKSDKAYIDRDKDVRYRVNNKIGGLKPGKYFIFIRVHTESLFGLQGAWTYTTLDIERGNNTITKIFPIDAKTYEYSPW